MSTAHSHPLSRRNRFLPALVLGLALGIFGVTVLLGLAQVRQKIRSQILNRDGEVLYAVALSQQAEAPSQANLDDPAEQLSLALRLSRLKEGVMAARLYDGQGRFVTAMPVMVPEAALAPEALAALRSLRPVSHYEARARLEELFLLPDGQEVMPLLTVTLPLHVPGQANLQAIAQLIMDGQELEREFAALDASLTAQALLVFLIGGGLLAGTLGWAFRRLHRQNRDLQRANQELALAAKTSAMGAVTAHLVHGLSNPLLGLQSFLSTHAEEPDGRDALASARRMRGLVDSVVRVLGEESAGAQYDLTLEELVEALRGKLQPAAQSAGVDWRLEVAAQGQMASRNANLVMMVLENLLQNAFQATPAGRWVVLALRAEAAGVVFEVADQGGGISDPMREKLFTPCRSDKPGGSGIGLAISRQLAYHLGGRLTLEQSSAQGSVFRLWLPGELVGWPAGARAEAAGAAAGRKLE